MSTDDSITLIWRSDAHLADTPPQSRTDDWAASILDKVVQTTEIALDEQALAILDGGDFFHIKSPGRNSHGLIQRVAEAHQGVTVYANVGNHDVKYGSMEYLDESPLGVLFKTRTFMPLFDEHEARFSLMPDAVNVEDVGTDRVKPALHVRVVGIPYHGTEYDVNRFNSITKGDEDFLVVVAHCLASSEGGEFFGAEDVLKYSDLANLDPDVWCFLPGTTVTDWNGRSLPIEDVGKSVALQGRSGPMVVEEVHPIREIDTEVVTLNIEGVPFELMPGVTSEHPFWVAKGLRCYLPSRVARRCHPDKVMTSHPCSSCCKSPTVSPDWYPASRIEKGDYVAIPHPKIPSDTVSEPGLARLLGYYLAEGHILENKVKEPIAGVAWSFHSEETELHEDVSRLVHDYFGLETKEHPYRKYGDNTIQVCAYGKSVAEFFAENGGRYSPTKEMSSWVWRLSASSRLELLVGWMLGDGHARSAKTEVMGGTTSPPLATQMFNLALSIGLRPYYTIRPEGESVFSNGETSPQLPFHCITFYGDDAEMLSHRMGVEPPKRSKTKVSGFFHEGLFWRRVREVGRKHYRGPVFNMRTSTNEYVAGLLLTHNCFGHWHKNQGIEEIAKGKWVVNIGSLSRGALVEDDLKRTPSCAILRFGKNGEKAKLEITEKPLRVKPAKDVFDIEGRVRAESRQMNIETFVEGLREVLTRQDDVSLKETIEGMDGIEDEVRERAINYLEQAGA